MQQRNNNTKIDLDWSFQTQKQVKKQVKKQGKNQNQNVITNLNQIKCINGNVALMYCNEKSCKQNSKLFLCLNQSCQCNHYHMNCKNKIDINWTIKKINQKTQKKQSIFKTSKINMQVIFSKLRRQINNFEQKVLNKMNQQLSQEYLSKSQLQFLRLYEGKQITVQKDKIQQLEQNIKQNIQIPRYEFLNRSIMKQLITQNQNLTQWCLSMNNKIQTIFKTQQQCFIRYNNKRKNNNHNNIYKKHQKIKQIIYKFNSNSNEMFEKRYYSKQYPIQMYNLLGLIDLQLQLLQKNSIFLVGLTRVGKSTVFNYINNKNLMGARKNGSRTIFYGIQIEDAQAAQTCTDIKSVTLLPNIVEKQYNGDKFTLVDLAGYRDQRRYPQVVCISYVLKAAFQIVDRCKFGLVASKQSFSAQNTKTLFKSILGFVNMFQFNLITDQTKQNILKSCTIIITKTEPNQQDQSLFANDMKMLAEQIQDKVFEGLKTKQLQNIAYILNYFAKNETQIYLFDKAIMNKPAPKCTLMENHFDKSPYFQSRNQNNKFIQNHSRSIFRTPYNEDIDNMPNTLQKIQLEAKIRQKIQSFDQMAKIMTNFLKKSIDRQNYFNRQNLITEQQFQKMRLFNKKYNVYPQYDYIQQSTLKNIFNPGQGKKIRNGIEIAVNVFKIYQIFQNLPECMEIFNTLIKILKLFRNIFCSSYEQQLLIQQFTFIAVRGCRQLFMLYEIDTRRYYYMYRYLKNSFARILYDTPLQDIHFDFIKNLYFYKDYSYKEEAIKLSNHKQCQMYLKYLKNVADKYEIIKSSVQLKQVRRYFLRKIIYYVEQPEDKLIYLFQNLLQQTTKTTQKIQELQQADASGWQQRFPQQLNFTIISILSRIGHILLQLQRPNQLSKDKFSFDDRKLQDGKNIKQRLNQTQSILAKDIFLYIKSVQPAKKAYQALINNFPKQNIQKKIEYMIGLAKYLAKNMQTEQTIILLQKAKSLCQEYNIFYQYQQIKKLFEKLFNEKQIKNKIYLKDLKKQRIIDLTDDQDLYRIIEALKIKFIQPYQIYKENKQRQEKIANRNTE